MSVELAVDYFTMYTVNVVSFHEYCRSSCFAEFMCFFPFMCRVLFIYPDRKGHPSYTSSIFYILFISKIICLFGFNIHKSYKRALALCISIR